MSVITLLPSPLFDLFSKGKVRFERLFGRHLVFRAVLSASTKQKPAEMPANLRFLDTHSYVEKRAVDVLSACFSAVLYGAILAAIGGIFQAGLSGKGRHKR